MPKPTRELIDQTLFGPVATHDRSFVGTRSPRPDELSARVVELFDAAWRATEEQCRRGDRALDVLKEYGARHLAGCDSQFGAPCGCGLDLAMDELRLREPDAESLPNEGATHPATWEYATGDDEEIPYDVALFNDGQRLRREGYGRACRELTTRTDSWCRDEAAKRYPLRVRARRIVPDPHGEGEWTTEETHFAAQENHTYAKWLSAEVNDAVFLAPDLMLERVRLMLDLLENPWTYVDDPNPESA